MEAYKLLIHFKYLTLSEIDGELAWLAQRGDAWKLVTKEIAEYDKA